MNKNLSSIGKQMDLILVSNQFWFLWLGLFGFRDDQWEIFLHFFSFTSTLLWSCTCTLYGTLCEPGLENKLTRLQKNTTEEILVQRGVKLCDKGFQITDSSRFTSQIKWFIFELFSILYFLFRFFPFTLNSNHRDVCDSINCRRTFDF